MSEFTTAMTGFFGGFIGAAGAWSFHKLLERLKILWVKLRGKKDDAKVQRL